MNGYVVNIEQASLENENFRKVFLNALLWIAQAEVPEKGVQCQLAPDDLQKNLDPKK